jgi:hypothetical protein
VPQEGDAKPLPRGLRRVVIIVKENRTFDEVFGDVESASNGTVNGRPCWRASAATPWSAARAAASQPDHPAQCERYAQHHEMARGGPSATIFTLTVRSAWTDTIGLWVRTRTPGPEARSCKRPEKLPLSYQRPGPPAIPAEQFECAPGGATEAGALWHHLERHGITFRNSARVSSWRVSMNRAA